MDPYVGQLLTLPWSWAPEGWASCSGQLLNASQYQALWSLIGNTYGGTSGQTFGVPDMRGRTVVGSGVDSNNQNWVFGTTGGAPTATLTSNNLPQHTHTATFVPSPASSTTVSATVAGLSSNVTLSAKYNAVSAAGATGVPSPGASLGIVNPGSLKLYTSASGTAVQIGTVTATGNLTGSVSVTATGAYPPPAGGSVQIGVTGAGAPFSILPPYLSMNVVIATNGLYPQRP